MITRSVKWIKMGLVAVFGLGVATTAQAATIDTLYATYADGTEVTFTFDAFNYNGGAVDNITPSSIEFTFVGPTTSLDAGTLNSATWDFSGGLYFNADAGSLALYANTYGSGSTTVGGTLVQFEATDYLTFTSSENYLWTQLSGLQFGYSGGAAGSASNVPAPATLLLMAIGLIGLALVSRRRHSLQPELAFAV